MVFNSAFKGLNQAVQFVMSVL